MEQWRSAFADTLGLKGACPGVAEVLLDPRRTWSDPAAYDAQAAKLVAMFSDNFAQYTPYIDDDVKACAIG